MDVLTQPVLVLNATYVPVAIRTVKDAVILLILRKAELIKDEKSHFIRSEKLKLSTPRIILLTDYYKVPKRKHKLSRENIFLRDDHECVYCRRKLPSSKLTLDHVIPKSRWEEIPREKKPKDYHTWENLVTACRDCNTKKETNFCKNSSGRSLKIGRQTRDVFHNFQYPPNWSKNSAGRTIYTAK